MHFAQFVCSFARKRRTRPFLLLAMGVKCNYLLFGKFNTETGGQAGAKARRAATPN